MISRMLYNGIIQYRTLTLEFGEYIVLVNNFKVTGKKKLKKGGHRDDLASEQDGGRF